MKTILVKFDESVDFNLIDKSQPFYIDQNGNLRPFLYIIKTINNEVINVRNTI